MPFRQSVFDRHVEFRLDTMSAAKSPVSTSPSRGNPSPIHTDTSYQLPPSITSSPPIPRGHHLPYSSFLPFAITDLTSYGLGHPSSPFYQFVIGAELAEPTACLECLESPSAGSYITTCAKSARCGPQEPPQLPTLRLMSLVLIAPSSPPPRPLVPPSSTSLVPSSSFSPRPPSLPSLESRLPAASPPYPSWSRPPLVSLLLPRATSRVCRRERDGPTMEGVGSKSMEGACGEDMHVSCRVRAPVYSCYTLSTCEVSNQAYPQAYPTQGQADAPDMMPHRPHRLLSSHRHL